MDRIADGHRAAVQIIIMQVLKLQEGFLNKQGGGRAKSWRRKYFVLSDGLLMYFDEKPTLENGLAQRPRGIVELSAFSVVRASRSSKAFSFELVARPHVLVLRGDSKQEAAKWETAICEAIEDAKHSRSDRRVECRRGWLTKRAVHSHRNWRKRFFVLRNGRLAYYETKPTTPTDRPKGMFEITANAVVRESNATLGWGKRNAFSLETGPENNRQVLQLSAASADERAAWVWVLHVAIVRKCGIQTDEAVKVGVWLHEHALGKYARSVVLDAGFSNFEHIKRMSETDMKALFRQASFTLNTARKFQNAARELCALSSDQMDMLGAPLGVGGIESLRNIADLDDDDVAAIVGVDRTHASQRRFGDDDHDDDNDDGDECGADQEHDQVDERTIAPRKQESLAPERRLYTWGDDSQWQLGIGSPSLGGTSANPMHVQSLKKKTEPHMVAAGDTCMAVITEREGQIFMWGSGPLGLKPKSSSNRPFLITSLRKVRMVHVSIGKEHVGAVSFAGDLYTWGTGRYGQLGLGDSPTETREPIMVDGVGSASGVPVTSVTCSDAHTVVLTENDCVFTMGKGRHGRLGLGDQDNRFVPTRVESLSGFKVNKIALGDRFSLAVTTSGMACFVWGRFGSEPVSLVPIRLQPFDEFDRPILDVAAAREMAIFLVGSSPGRDTFQSLSPRKSDGRDQVHGSMPDEDAVESSVFTMGPADAPLGIEVTEPLTKPTIVEALENYNVVQVSCSGSHAAALCQDGRLLTWGSDERGALGSGYFVSTQTPVSARCVNAFRYKSVVCGGEYTAAIGEYDESCIPSKAAGVGATIAGTLKPRMRGPRTPEDEKIASKISEITQLLRDVQSEPPPLVDNDGFPLPMGSRRFNDTWLEHKDPKTGRPYYENMDTREVQWHPPASRAA
ncbi:RCC1 and BTB domain-containing protein 1 [Hondaea fermentalgiana]|uniref:RCC1 and BTB domain-containing protein 1 n=1 Tax=Hondaea fermentalgiana TaxID=2315210 RepID=A0A2R5G6I0_9STRA|nr:RCC1 and BTB domain-containing protein 1 [Hondaea fermentalgiana]|eukprot:GBG25929.1 RCC1 and BTB domain-containing protein 1 [Hondaea fermentalgiana]